MAALRPLRVSASVGEVRAYLLAAARTTLAGHWRRTLGREITTLDDDDRRNGVRRPAGVTAGPGPHRRDPGRPAGAVPTNPRAAVSRRLLGAGGGGAAGGQRGQRQGAAVSRAAPGRPGGAGGGPSERTGSTPVHRGPAERAAAAARSRPRRPTSRSFAPRSACGRRDRDPARRARSSSPICTGGWPPSTPAGDPEGGPVRTIGGTRRRFVQGAAIAAAAAAVGVAVDRTLITGGRDDVPGDGQQAAPAAQTLTPSVGDWRTVAASEELPDGAVRAFDLTQRGRFRATHRRCRAGGVRHLHPSGLPAAAGRRLPAVELPVPPDRLRGRRGNC